ncbi:MAG TPA: hypothetical protein VMT57_07810 [Candidatus Thermoplasmatota archaeon]|nr:hypothetical protein [Candidatus Thermoplasmatota archaeon]
MRQYQRALTVIFLALLSTSISSFPVGVACKDIIATSQATGADYTLLLKVRDPSRPGLQVLTRVPKGTTYTYHYPWSGKPWTFTVNHTYFGIATLGDTPPNITKAGMVLSDAGLVFADADTASGWVNPTKNAWDDFDWIRYACQTAGSDLQAITLLTTDAIDSMHATSVGENLFIASPAQAAVIEADAFHYTTSSVDDVWIMSNYPLTLWRTELLKSLPIARSFDAQKDTWVRQGGTVRLGSVCGVKILAVNDTALIAQAVPTFAFQPYEQGNPVVITIGHRGTVGPYSVIYETFQKPKARVSVQTAVHAWEQAVRGHVEPAVGHITLQDMFAWSRMHTSDLDGLRPLCEDASVYEAAAVFKLPTDHPDILGCGWFSANHACSSIYVPFHICDDDIYTPYQTGEAAQLSLDLLKKYGHATLTPACESVEAVLLAETNLSEGIAHAFIHSGINATPFMTAADLGIQGQAYLTEQLWLSLPNASQAFLRDLWSSNYNTSLLHMKKAVVVLTGVPGGNPTVALLKTIMLSIERTQAIQTSAARNFSLPKDLDEINQ